MATPEEISAAYQKVLGRGVDPSGAASYGASGMSAAQVEADLAKSGEFSNLLPSFAQETTAGVQSLLASQKAEQAGLFGQYTAASKAQEPLSAAYTRLGQEAGVPELTSTIQGFKTQMAGVQGKINQLEQAITERTKGHLVSATQRAGIQAYEQQGLTREMGAIGTAMLPSVENLSAAQQQIATKLGLISADQQKDLQPLIMQIDALSDRFAREMQGYTQAKTTEFNALLAKVQRGWQLQDAEIARANELADAERAWERTKEQMAIEYSNSARLKGIPSASETSTTPTLAEALSAMSPYVNYGQTGAVDIWNPDIAQWVTREAAGRTIASQTGVNYNDVMKQIYSQFPG